MDGSTIRQTGYLHTILSNSREMMRSENDVIEVFSAMPDTLDWIKTDMMAYFDLVRKFQTQCTPAYVDDLLTQVNAILQISERRQSLEVLIEREGKTIAIILAIWREMLQNQKRLWQHAVENSRINMPLALVDAEIGKVEALAQDLGLTLPSL